MIFMRLSSGGSFGFIYGRVVDKGFAAAGEGFGVGGVHEGGWKCSNISNITHIKITSTQNCQSNSA
jgi:hypothetical protein